MTAAASQHGPVIDEGVLDARLVACYRAAELLVRGGLAGETPQQAMNKAQELRGALVAADDDDLPALEAQITALEAHLRAVDDGIDDNTFKAGLSVVTRGGLLGYGRVLLGGPFDNNQRAERFVLLARWLLARDAGEGRLFLPSREELATFFEQLLVG
ncbi:MAG: hypothetical protein OXT09_35595, partial [Myxococcales bacterium]|nr:hypothetical protein [Myxococcales bacterium]